jgi:hypothetical protein
MPAYPITEIPQASKKIIFSIDSDLFKSLEEDLKAGFSLFWSIAEEILQNSGVKLLTPIPELFSIENNFFSMLFLYSYRRASFPKTKQIFYTAVNQCLRGMVTGCDNILDNEYKETLPTDLPKEGTKFRSVFDIMVCDRILFQLLLKRFQNKELVFDQVLYGCMTSLQALLKSGVQEASEEGGIDHIMEPDELLRKVHHYKTGVLFQCPWAVPQIIEGLENAQISHILEALYRIGMGCQIMDDMVDLGLDLRKNRHNYIVSLIRYDSDPKEWHLLKNWLTYNPNKEEDADLLLKFPRAMSTAGQKALKYLEEGACALFAEQHQSMVKISVNFIARRIGAERFILKLKG